MGISEYERVPLDEWHAIETHLRDFAEDAEVSESAEGVSVTVGNGRFSVTRGGRVSAGMALHEFEGGGIEALYFDHEDDRIRVETGDLSYEFRKP